MKKNNKFIIIWIGKNIFDKKMNQIQINQKRIFIFKLQVVREL